MRPRFWSLVIASGIALPAAASAAPPEGPWLTDRGTGVWTSIFGTYVRSHELLVSPFVEAYWDDDFEYKPEELGYGLDQDFVGRYRAVEGLMFFAYGFNDRLAIELEAAAIHASLEKAANDPSAMPAKLEESGPGDWQVELDWRVAFETARRPEVFAFFELTPPSNINQPLIGTADWEYKAGVGLIRGLRWGTVSARVAAAYAQDEGVFELGEYAVEYLKRVSPHWKVYGGVEGEQDEVELIGEAQWHPSERWYLRLNTSYGLTAKATDWAPDVGVVFSFP